MRESVLKCKVRDKYVKVYILSIIRCSELDCVRNGYHTP
jgi:hypothetical protein